MSDVEEISPEAWADACDSRGDLFTATVIRHLIAERDEALAATTDLAEQAEPTLLELRYAELSIDVLRDFLRADRLERDEALGEATRLADLLAVVGQTCDEVDRGRLLLIPALRRIWAAARTPESGPLAAERPDPFHGHHPEHSTPQEGTQ